MLKSIVCIIKVTYRYARPLGTFSPTNINSLCSYNEYELILQDENEVSELPNLDYYMLDLKTLPI